MSHYTVLVVGDNVEEQLEPFNENTQVEAYIDGTPEDTLKMLENGLAYFQEDADPKQYVGRTVESLTREEQLRILASYGGGDYREDDGGNLIHYSTYNPDSKWDWWEEGGRWSGFFFVKPGVPTDAFVASKVHWSEQYQGEDSVDKDVVGTTKAPNLTDSALKMHIDFELMRKDAEIQALQDFEKFEEATKDTISPGSWKAFARSIVGPAFDEDRRDTTPEERAAFTEKIDEARRLFSEYPFVQEARKLRYWGDVHEIFCLDAEDPKAAYVEKRIKARVTTYSVLMNGQWYSQGEMGWFGMSDDKLTDDEWSAKVAELIDSLPQDTRLTLVDVHI